MDQTYTSNRPNSRRLRIAKNSTPADTPSWVEEFVSDTNSNTRLAYRNDIKQFVIFTGLHSFEELGGVTREQVIAWRESLVQKNLSSATIRRKLAALSAGFTRLCDKITKSINPVDGVERPKVESGEVGSLALAAKRVRLLFSVMEPSSLKVKRDRAILATLAYHGLRRSELCDLNVEDLQKHNGVISFRIGGRGHKMRFVPVRNKALDYINEYLAEAGHGEDMKGPLFRPVKNIRSAITEKPLHPTAIYKAVIRRYAKKVSHQYKEDMQGFGVHSLRAIAATNALEHGADAREVQVWLGHANLASTLVYARKKISEKNSPSFRIDYYDSVVSF